MSKPKTGVKAAANAPAGEASERSFEDVVQRLGKIVERLEGGELPLEESLELFEEGVRLARASQARLDAAEQRVEELLGIDEDGEPVVRELASD
ncbi:MAG: exodeoxyribonuclease VII small subunit [Sorangiineae bacterium]|nr:exodeoxyribonuclease VII small subunit [Polyangiaceae bacterium]MEB2325039.1 exodeoxyribonuclease VII small subunit [Sorangiineae bacterium]